MNIVKKLFATFLCSIVISCGGEPGIITSDVAPNNNGGTGGAGSVVTVSSGAVNAPITITSLPINGAVSGTNHGYYAYTTISAVDTITLTGITSDMDPVIYTSSAFSTIDTNWTCTANASTASDTCYATSPVPSGTTLYIKIKNYAGQSASYIIGITSPTTGSPGSPVAIASMPYAGQVVNYSNSYYAYTTIAASIGTISATGLSGDIDLTIYTDATFSTADTNWTCSANIGTTAESCIATVPVTTGTVLYILAKNLTSFGAGAIFSLDVAP